jgi:hypothetical protein
MGFDGRSIDLDRDVLERGLHAYASDQIQPLSPPQPYCTVRDGVMPCRGGKSSR